MQYLIKLVNGAPSGHPVSLSNLRQVNKRIELLNKDFITSEEALEEGYGTFIPRKPLDNKDLTKTYREVLATEQDLDGNWVQAWALEDIVFDTEEDRQNAITATAENNLNELRAQRNALLVPTDWAGLSDVTMSTEMRTYRQALRDLPATYADNPEDVVFPVAPGSSDDTL